MNFEQSILWQDRVVDKEAFENMHKNIEILYQDPNSYIGNTGTKAPDMNRAKMNLCRFQ